MDVTIRLTCTKLPGRAFAGISNGEAFAYSNVHVGLQRGEEIVDTAPGDAEVAIFEPVFRVERTPDGRPNFLGPYAKGPKDERFFYLSWVEKAPSGALTRFRRAKIHLGHLDWSVVEAAARTGAPIEAELALTDRRGGPLCASVRDGVVRWKV